MLVSLPKDQISGVLRLKQQEIQSILKSLRKLDRKKKLEGEVVATAGEILAEEVEGDFERDSATDDTRVRTAISWLEEAVLLVREEPSEARPSQGRAGGGVAGTRAARQEDLR